MAITVWRISRAKIRELEQFAVCHGKCVQENFGRYLLGIHGTELDAIGSRGMITWWFQGHVISMLFATLLGMIANDYFGPFRICQGLEITNQTPLSGHEVTGMVRMRSIHSHRK